MDDQKRKDMKKQSINIFTKIYPVSKEDNYEDSTVADKEDSTRAKFVVSLTENSKTLLRLFMATDPASNSNKGTVCKYTK